MYRKVPYLLFLPYIYARLHSNKLEMFPRMNFDLIRKTSSQIQHQSNIKKQKIQICINSLYFSILNMYIYKINNIQYYDDTKIQLTRIGVSKNLGNSAYIRPSLMYNHLLTLKVCRVL